MNRSVAIFVCSLLFIASYGQNETNVWYFGTHAGINFSSGTPSVLNDGKINTTEGVACISDSAGNLLFYTDGVTVWNNQHDTMANGRDLFGHYSSSQSSIIVPKPRDPHRYFVFTVDFEGASNGMNYSVVNMDLDNGKGDVEEKNVQLVTPVCEKLTAIKHCNGTDFWVITHGFNSQSFYAFLVTANGVSLAPVLSNVGSFVSNINQTNAIGSLKASPDGRKLAAAHYSQGVELLDFDNSTGAISNARSLFTAAETYEFWKGPYGVEFSPNSKLLYVAGNYYDFQDLGFYSFLLQYDVSLLDQVAISASKSLIYRKSIIIESFGSLQTAPDGKIYLAEIRVPYLSVINAPNMIGSACLFTYAQLQFTEPNQLSMMGLPAFVQSYWRPAFTFRGACAGKQLFFDYVIPEDVIAVKWDFGDPLSGSDNFSTLDSTMHLYQFDGVYPVKLIRFTHCGSDTVTKSVQVGESHVSLGADQILCDESGYQIEPVLPAIATYTYLWQDNSTSPAFNANNNGLYWVEIKNNLTGCTSRDSVNLLFNISPSFNLGNDITACSDEAILLSVNIDGEFAWNTGNVTNIQVVEQSGIYWIDVSKNGCTMRDSVTVTFNPSPQIYLGNDTTLCDGQTLLLDAGNSGEEYFWHNGNSSQTFLVSAPGDYSVRVNQQGCSDTDTIQVQYDSKPFFSLGQDLGICEGQILVLQPAAQMSSSYTYLWENGLTGNSLPVDKEGVYSLIVSNSCGSSSDSVTIIKGICKLFVPTAFTPNGDGLNDIFRVEFGENTSQFSFDVYNRWGQNLFHSLNISEGWDGKVRGLSQPTGVYVWVIRFRSLVEQKDNLLKGTIMLLR
jgi:gliding motility-associated-like protein